VTRSFGFRYGCSSGINVRAQEVFGKKTHGGGGRGKALTLQGFWQKYELPPEFPAVCIYGKTPLFVLIFKITVTERTRSR
jgi:hypothetical protein